MTTTWPTKDPSELFEIVFNWLPQLEVDGDTLTGSLWEVSTGILNQGDSFDADSTTIWISGGEHGQLYTLKNTVNTTNGRVWASSIKVRCRDKYCLVDV